MVILAVDNNLITHRALVYCVSETWPEAELHRFTDPLLCLKYGINHKVDLLITAVQMRGATGEDITRILRQHSPDLWAVYVTDLPAQSGADFQVAPNSAVQRPVTVEKLLAAADRGAVEVWMRA